MIAAAITTIVTIRYHLNYHYYDYYYRIDTSIFTINISAATTFLSTTRTYWSSGYDVGFWIQRSAVRTLAASVYVESLSRTLNPHCFSRLSCEISTRREYRPREGCLFSAMSSPEEICCNSKSNSSR